MKLIESLSINCKNCYKCLRQCTVKAISYKNDKAKVEPDACILCGHCSLICPQEALVMRDDYDHLKEVLADKSKVIYASIAPSFITDFDVPSFAVFKKMLNAIGVSECEETIVGAKLVNVEYEKLLKESDKLMISTACPVVINYVKKYFPELIDNLAPVLSPMAAHAKYIKEHNPDAYVIFIGPCLAKKDEMTWEDDLVDDVFTFEELNRLFVEKNINSSDYSCGCDTEKKENLLRLYPTSGGVISSLSEKNPNVSYISLDGVDNLKTFFEEASKNEIKNTFVEASACNGSCLNGPCRAHKEHCVLSKMKLDKYVKSSSGVKTFDYVSLDLSRKFVAEPVPWQIPTNYEIREILSQIGKKDKSQELNCGACGFNSCYDKAIAVYNKRAELSMCLPYMKQRAETLSWEIINNSPNGILAFDGELVLQKINPKAYEYLGIPLDTKLEDIKISEYLDMFDYELMITGARENTLKKKIHIEKTNKTIECAMVYVKELDFIFGVYMDVTDDELKEEFLHNARHNTVNTANELIDKQMRAAQEIASLLGETVAETKIALTNLKKAMEEERDDE